MYQANLLTTCARCFLERGGYFFIMRQPPPRTGIPPNTPLATGNTSPYAIPSIWSARHPPLGTGGSLLSSSFHTIEAGPPVHLLSRRRPTQNCVWPITISTLNFQCSRISCKRSRRQQGILLEGVELNCDDWANGKATVDPSGWGRSISPFPKSGTSAVTATAPLYCATPSVVGMMRCWPNGETQWHAETISAGTTGQGNHLFSWLQPLFHHWMRLKSPDRAVGIHLNNPWFDFRSLIEPGLKEERHRDRVPVAQAGVAPLVALQPP